MAGSGATRARGVVRTLPLALRAIPVAWREHRAPQQPLLIGLSGLCLLLAVLYLQVSTTWFTSSLQILPLLAGGLLLRPSRMRVLIVVAFTCVSVEIALEDLDTARPGEILATALTAFAAYELTRSHEQTGLGAFGGENVLLELGERLVLQGRIPVLPPEWHSDTVVHPAGDVPFAGDFVVSMREGDLFEVALVDVSGKGADAGTRSLLLSGALGGLLGSGSPGTFLARGNSYLVRQDWEEGFATAAQVSIDLATGAYTVASAGHPPVAHFDAGTGKWTLHEDNGPALGLIPEMEYEQGSGVLDRGDALLLYTDGLVEVAGRDLAYGIDKLLGAAERTIADGFAGGAEGLVTRVISGSGDDRGLVLVWREV